VNTHTLESLRLTLHDLEQTCGPNLAPDDLPELRRILLTRIAELEATPAREGPSLDAKPVSLVNIAMVPVAPAPPAEMIAAAPEEVERELKLKLAS
jgi:hypothetical protein